MNDKTPRRVERLSTRPRNGWEKHTTVGFNDLIGPLWRREDGDGCGSASSPRKSTSTASTSCTAAC